MDPPKPDPSGFLEIGSTFWWTACNLRSRAQAPKDEKKGHLGPRTTEHGILASKLWVECPFVRELEGSRSPSWCNEQSLRGQLPSRLPKMVYSLPEFLDFIRLGKTISGLDLFWPIHLGSEYTCSSDALVLYALRTL